MTRVYPLCRARWAALVIGFGATIVTAAGATVHGRVFLDENNDGQRGAQERGLANVVVSDGRTLVTTNADGDYAIEVAGEPFVFVVLPRGYRARGQQFYAEASRSGPIDFALVDWPESLAGPLRLVQISDTHLRRDDEEVRRFAADAAEINELTPKAAFALSTGDLVNVGSNAAEMEAYCEGSAAFKLPLFNLPGSHDVKDAEGLEHYHRYFGPDNYSFNAGACHFVLLNYLRLKQPALTEWIKRDIALAPKGSTLVIGIHNLPSEADLKFFRELGARAVLSGHWHGHRVQETAGIADLNTPTLRFGGIDRHPRSFRVVEFAGGEVKNELRLGGFRHHGVVVAPAATVDAGPLPLLVNAYDTRVDIESVDCEVAGRRVALVQTSPWSWAAEGPVLPAKAGAQRVVATIRARNGEVWQAESTFEVKLAADAANAAPLQLAWAVPTGGFIGISSPQVGRELVVVGVDDKGDLRSCGVAAFDRAGRKRWHFHSDSGIKNNIAVGHGLVFATSVVGTLYTLDEATGKLRWQAGLGRERERWEITATTVADGVVHVGSTSYVAAFAADTGKKLWETRVPKSSDWSPNSFPVPTVVRGRLLLFHLRYGAASLDARTGALAWQHDGAFNGCLSDGDTLYTVRNNVLTALAFDTGQQLWAGKAKLGSSASKPLLTERGVVVGTADGRVCLVSTKDGSLIWSAQTGPSLTSLQPYQRGGSDVNSSPAVNRGVVYVGASDGRVHAFALNDGANLGTYDLGVPVASSPTIADGMLYIGGYDGNLYALRIPR